MEIAVGTAGPALLHPDRAKPDGREDFRRNPRRGDRRSRDMDAPLGERLKAVADEVRRVSPEFAATVDRMVARLAANNVGQTAPKPGESMPDFILPDEGGRLVRLTDLLDTGPSSCRSTAVTGALLPAQCGGARRDRPRVESLGAQIVAISPEKPDTARSSNPTRKRRFPSLPTSTTPTRSRSTCCSGSGTKSAKPCRPEGTTSLPIRGTMPGCCRSPHLHCRPGRCRQSALHRSRLPTAHGPRRALGRAAIVRPDGNAERLLPGPARTSPTARRLTALRRR